MELILCMDAVLYLQGKELCKTVVALFPGQVDWELPLLVREDGRHTRAGEGEKVLCQAVEAVASCKVEQSLLVGAVWMEGERERERGRERERTNILVHI